MTGILSRFLTQRAGCFSSVEIILKAPSEPIGFSVEGVGNNYLTMATNHATRVRIEKLMPNSTVQIC